MRRFSSLIIIIIIITTILLTSQLKAQNIVDILSSLYFDANLNHLDSTLVASFKANKSLKYFNINSIIKNSRGEPAKNEFFHRFSFEHDNLNGDSLSGNIYVETKKVNGTEKVTYLMLTYDKLNEKRSDSLFDYLSKLFQKYDKAKLSLGVAAKSRYFDFNLINSAAFLHKGQSDNLEYLVQLCLYTK